jgi:hypothetical protein
MIAQLTMNIVDRDGIVAVNPITLEVELALSARDELYSES